MRMNPAMGLLAALAILPAAASAAEPSAACPAHAGHHDGYCHGLGWGPHHGRGPAAVGLYPYGLAQPIRAYRHGWWHDAPGTFSSSSSAVAVGSFACLRDPAYRMDPRC
jgi:hypothetical protein